MQVLNYINGKMQAAINGGSLDNFEPATGKVYGSVADSDGADVALAYEAANAAKISWANTPAEEK